jgi:anti-sigma regulatory factor (Ser/Thr protein kinase)
MSSGEEIRATGAARTAPDPPPGVEAPADPPLDQPFDADALYALRSAVAAHATELGAGSVVGDAVLVAHELSSNAVRHGGRCGRLLLWRDGERLYCQVTDSGGGISDPAHAGTSRPPPSVPGGRGLWIARQLASIEIATGPTGTTITAALTLRRED